MILPDKYIPENKSLLFIGGQVIFLLKKPQTISKLWDAIKLQTKINSFEHFILSLDLLFLMNVVKLENNKIKLRDTK